MVNIINFYNIFLKKFLTKGYIKISNRPKNKPATTAKNSHDIKVYSGLKKKKKI